MKKDLVFIIIGLIMAIGFVYTGFEYEQTGWYIAAVGVVVFVCGVVLLLNHFRN